MKNIIRKLFKKETPTVQGVDLSSGPDQTTYQVPPSQRREVALRNRLNNPNITEAERKQLLELLENRRKHNLRKKDEQQ